MKKILALILVFVMLIPSGAVFADSFNVRADVVQAKPGDTVDVNITFENNSGIVGARFFVEYDRDLVELVGAREGKVLKGGTFSPTYASYPYTMVWASASHVNFTDDGILAVLSFRVKDDARSKMAFVNILYQENDVYDVDLENVHINVINGGISIESNNSEHGNDTLTGGDNSTDNDTSAGNDASTGSDTPDSNGDTNADIEKPASGTDKEDNNSTGGRSPSSGSSGTRNPSSSVSGTKIPVSDSEKKPENTIQNQIILTINQKEATVFGEQTVNDVAPIIRNSRTMLPARFVAENLGAEVAWDETAPGIVTVTRGDTKIVIYIGADYAMVNSETVKLDSPAFIENDRTYTPVRFIAENLGAEVEWVEGEQKVILNMPK